MKRYERFADQLATLMTTGVLAPGERLPSVRSASRTHGISPSTVFQAYYLLESRGLIEARERSGYFVREPARSHDAAPVLAPLEGTEVAVSDLVYSVLQSLQDPDIVPFGSAFPSPDLFPLARLARSMAHGLRDLPAHDLTAYVTPGHPELRRQIARRYGLAGMPDVGEELVITHGALEALNLGLQSLTRPGDLVAVESPAFYASLQVLERLQLKAVEIPVDPERGLNLDALAEALGRLPIKACWFMSGLQNPTGVSLDDRAQQRLYGLLQRHQVPLLEDDVYAELYSGSEPHRPIKRFDSEGLVLHCGSFSKCLAPGYRIGWIAAGRQAGAVARLRLMTTITPSMPAQAALADYLQHGGYDRPSAPAATESRPPAPGHAGCGAPLFSRGNQDQPAPGRLLPLVRATRSSGQPGALSSGPGQWHQPGAGTDLFRATRLSPLHQTQLRASLGRAQRGGHGQARRLAEGVLETAPHAATSTNGGRQGQR
ncbi:DNA-binding transcriptional MocR family regulator [Pseudomonas psychrotolerans]|nr:DNA-binding transcriptional MocR family regulator [Pseudomonas psychrotolerans]